MAASSEISANGRRRGPGKPFVPGQSGNPLGRSKAALDVQSLAKQHTAAAIETLVAALRDPKLKVQAAEALLNRAWGRPVTPVVTDGADGDRWQLHLVAARNIAVELRTERETAEQPTIEGTASPLPPDLNRPALE